MEHFFWNVHEQPRAELWEYRHPVRIDQNGDLLDDLSQFAKITKIITFSVV